MTQTVEGRERHAVRVRYPRRWREDEEAVRGLLVPARGPREGEAPVEPEGSGPAEAPPAGGPHLVPPGEAAEVRVVEGPAAITSENGLLRNSVRLNVRSRIRGRSSPGRPVAAAADFSLAAGAVAG